ncbi:histidinol-phosphate transaminase [Paenibacillus radicis (ex Gao et al. 2016)]|uniref:Histidinol-phosphate aminotransferase n=1 Tax=Paenibacillus radicis (ex Gao et al. 2016) TaxID=1737354 RepID=A0A917LUR5_9BACL|nr:histidinol-phosphate transaminase [Paenibacillus radicis (ex Gao et al. 2016)]GGG57767.1 histidinol-phosphate aminotransferase [Paenibacillus radicis (ex Gao et al. 2016)]
MQPKSNIVHLPVYQPGKPIEDVKRELGLTEVIKLASNENPLGSSELARAAAIQELGQSHIYPDGASVELTAVLAEHLSVQTNQIIFGTGSSEIILMAARAFLAPGDETIMADETFSQYKHNAEVENARLIEVPLANGKHDLPAMLAKVTERTKIIWVCNPNNPTGTIVTKDELVSFLDQVPKHVLVILDEAYCEFVSDPDFPDGLQLLDRYRNLLVLRTFSKIYGLASLRIGYGVGHPDVIRFINQVREPFNTTRMAQAAAKAAIADQDFIDRCRKENAEGIAFMAGRFDALGLSYFPAHGNFIMVDVKRPSMEMFGALLRKGIITRAGWTYYPTHIRVSIGTKEQNEKFMTALEQVLQESAVHG